MSSLAVRAVEAVGLATPQPNARTQACGTSPEDEGLASVAVPVGADRYGPAARTKPANVDDTLINTVSPASEEETVTYSPVADLCEAIDRLFGDSQMPWIRSWRSQTTATTAM